MTRFARWAALAVASALLAAGCSGGSSDDDKGGLSWGRCKTTADGPAPSSDWQCATLKVPLDWSKPTARR